MKRLRIILTLIFCSFVGLSCDKPNVLTEYSWRESDEAYFHEAKKKIDNSDWDGAIAIITGDLSSTYQQRMDVRETLMHAYGGKCGISLFDMIHNLKNVSASSMFEITLQIFAQKQIHVAACDQAVDILLGLGGTAAQRTNNQNLFAAILGLTRIGTTLKSKLDTESAGLGDGAVDANSNVCENVDAPLHLSDADMNRVATGMGLLFENLAALGEQLTSGGAESAFEDAKALCQTPLNLPPILQPVDYGLGNVTWASLGLPDPPTYEVLGFGPDLAEPYNCLATRAVDVSPKMRNLYRRLLDTAEMGFGNCDLSDVTLKFEGGAFKIEMDCCSDLAVP